MATGHWVFADPPDEDHWVPGDYRLTADSPCVDAGDNRTAPRDVADLDLDGHTSERISIDLNETARFVDNPNIADTGVPILPDYPAVIDMGPYEYETPDDCNNNGVSDAEEVASQAVEDCNGNERPDSCELAYNDCNGNGIPDDCDLSAGTSMDCDGNQHPDECDADFDNDGQPDACDDDIDGDGVNNAADACSYSPPSIPVTEQGRSMVDYSEDCLIDLADYRVMDNCLSSGGPDMAPTPLWCLDLFDVDRNGDTDLADFAAFQAASQGGQVS